MNTQADIQDGLTRLAWASLIVGLLAIAACCVGAVSAAQQFFRAYLVAYLFWSSITIGTLGIIFLHHLTGGKWGLGIRRLLEIASGTMPLIVILFIPLLLGLGELYQWGHGPTSDHGRIYHHKMLYFRLPFFLGRAGLYFLVWLVMAVFANHWSRQQDAEIIPTAMRRLRLFSAPALIVWGFAVTFAAFDWIMSLEPDWYSSIYGLIFLVGHALCALCFVIVVAVLLMRLGPFAELMGAQQFNDLGNLLLTFVILWAYLAFSQYLLIWSGNLREEIVWYTHRTYGVWRFVALALIVLHFFVPFFLLLSRRIKRERQALAGVALLVLVLQWFSVLWNVEPAFLGSGFHWRNAWMDSAADIGVGGIWIAAFLWRLKRTPVMTAYSRVPEGGHAV
jgi:hypothetical protein